MNDGDGISAGYCFSAAPPPTSGGRGRGRVIKGRNAKSSSLLNRRGFAPTPVNKGIVDTEKKSDNVVADAAGFKHSFVFGGNGNGNGTVFPVLGDSIASSHAVQSISDSPLDVFVPPSVASQSVKTGANVESFSAKPPASSCIDAETNSGLHFSNKTDGIEFKSASVNKPSLFSGVDQGVEFTTTTKRHVAKSAGAKKKKDKMKLKPVQTRHELLGKDFLVKDMSPSTFCFSPNLLPFPEHFSSNRLSRESSIASHDSYELGTSEQSDSRLSESNDAIEDLAVLTQQLGFNEHGLKSQEIVGDASNYGTTSIPEVDSSLGNISRTSNAAADGLDSLNENTIMSVETAASSNETNRIPEVIVTSTSIATSQPKFQFSASPPVQEFTATRVFHKKNQLKPGTDNFSANQNVTNVSSYTQLTAGASIKSYYQTKKKGDLPYSRDNDEGVCKNDAVPVNAGALFAQELCEKWRLRGNQAYASGDFSKAEQYYTNGVNAIPQAEKSKTCHRVLVLCYSNRAASRMSLGKMRGALEDCMFASAIDPSFLKAQLRTANCYLALGEVEDASRCFKKILQLGADVVDHKTLAEASDGLQNAQKVSQCINQDAKLPPPGVHFDAEKLLQAIDEALLISPYCEKLLETKAETLFKLRKYEDVIQLCEHSLGSAELNWSTSINDAQSEYQDESILSKYYYFRQWRCHLIVKSCFQLGKLEQAVDLLEKEASREGNKLLESSIPLACTVRDLVRHKAAGNDAFQLGKYEVAVEHYSTALANNLSSRPFAAICYCNRAAAYKALNQIADAISDCSLAIALDRNYTKAISRRASLFEVVRDYDQAAKDLRRLVSMLKTKIEENKNIFETSDKSTNLSLANDLREAEVRLSEMEEEARKDVPVNFYLILGVELLASPAEIRKAYRNSALKHHPDKAGQILGKFEVEDDALRKEMVDNVRRDTDRLFKMIGEAYAVLYDSTKRSLYDSKEDLRSSHRKGKGSSSPSDFQNHMSDRSSSGRQWTDMWKSYRQSQGQDANRSKWYAG